MSALLEGTETKLNLMRAFAGENQARGRYTFAAELAEKEGLYAVGKALIFTAEQELAHAKVFYGYLGEFEGKSIEFTGGYPVNLEKNVLAQLEYAEHNELEEYGDVYANFAKTAESEGFASIAASFANIAQIEKTHADRFAEIARGLRDKTLYVRSVESGWMCLNCGYVYRGLEVPPKCPVCTHDRGFFISLELAPYTK